MWPFFVSLIFICTIPINCKVTTFSLYMILVYYRPVKALPQETNTARGKVHKCDNAVSGCYGHVFIWHTWTKQNVTETCELYGKAVATFPWSLKGWMACREYFDICIKYAGLLLFK